MYWPILGHIYWAEPGLPLSSSSDDWCLAYNFLGLWMISKKAKIAYAYILLLLLRLMAQTCPFDGKLERGLCSTQQGINTNSLKTSHIWYLFLCRMRVLRKPRSSCAHGRNFLSFVFFLDSHGWKRAFAQLWHFWFYICLPWCAFSISLFSVTCVFVARPPASLRLGQSILLLTAPKCASLPHRGCWHFVRMYTAWLKWRKTPAGNQNYSVSINNYIWSNYGKLEIII